MKTATIATKRTGQVRQHAVNVTTQLRATLAWYFAQVYGHLEGPGSLPFYCDPEKVGYFAVSPSELATGQSSAFFKLFVVMAMFQARRDVVIMRQQAAMSAVESHRLFSTKVLTQLVNPAYCDQFVSAATFDAGCSVQKNSGTVDCARHPGAPCHVKDATGLLKRMGDMGKLPTSAWLHAWKGRRLPALLKEVQAAESKPEKRAELLVERFSRIYRVGTKLATMFVSALSMPALAPGLTPWFPAVDGNTLVIVDTNVARAVDRLRKPGAAGTYAARAQWLREQAQAIDLREFDADLPRFSPRLLQQALYSFCSKSNRLGLAGDCSARSAPRFDWVPALCPFIGTNPARLTPDLAQSINPIGVEVPLIRSLCIANRGKNSIALEVQIDRAKKTIDIGIVNGIKRDAILQHRHGQKRRRARQLSRASRAVHRLQLGLECIVKEFMAIPTQKDE